MTTTVTTAIAAREIRTTFVSIRRLRRCGGPRRRGPRLAVIAPAEAGVVLVDVELAVEPEVLRVRPQEALDVGLRRQQLEALVLEGAEVLPRIFVASSASGKSIPRRERASWRLLPISNMEPERVPGYLRKRRISLTPSEIPPIRAK